MKSLRDSKKGLFAIISLVLLGFIQLEAGDECALRNSELSTTLSSSSTSDSHSDNVYYKNVAQNDSDTVYVNVTEAGKVTINLTSSSGVVFSYDDTRCPGRSGGTKTLTQTIVQPKDFNLLVYIDDAKDPVDYTLEITFIPTTTPPVADAGPDQSVEEDESVTLDGSGSSDSDGSISSYTWRYGTDQWMGVSPTISTSGWGTGYHTITLTVVDNRPFKS